MLAEAVRGHRWFDGRAVVGMTIDDLDRGYVARDRLAALHLTDRAGVPTVAGALVLGNEPTRWLGGAYVQFVRVQGAELRDPIVVREQISGPLPRVLGRIDDLISAHVRVATTVVGTTRETRAPDFPSAALQQLVRNAVIHRDYATDAPVTWTWFSDRVEIYNPGGLFGRVTPPSFGHIGGIDYRNPVVAAVMYELGFAQRLGVGIQLIRKACADNGNPPPEFAFGANSFGVTVRTRS